MALCVITKTASPAQWQQGAKPGSLKTTFGVVCEPPRRGLIIEIYINRGHKVKRRTLNFGLWDTKSGGFDRVYQLTVADANSPTHTERGVTWFGSHEHMGDKAIQQNILDYVSFAEALIVFLKKICLTLDETIIDPLDPNTYELKP